MIARWDGTQWDNMNGGLAFPSPTTWKGVFSMRRYQDVLYVGGGFSLAGGVAVDNLAVWNGRDWSQVPGSPYGAITALGEHQGWLYVGSSVVSGIYRWNGREWQDLSGQLKFGKYSVGPRSFASVDSTLYILVHTSPPQIGYASALYTFNDAGFNAFAPPNGVWLVRTLLSDGFGLYVAGQNYLPGGAVKRWNGEAYQSLGNGVGQSSNDSVRAMFLDEGTLYAGGKFSVAGGEPASNIAAWACVCPSDCDNSGSLDIDDFVCFTTIYSLGQYQADCDGSGALTIDDFVCFQTLFAFGC